MGLRVAAPRTTAGAAWHCACLELCEFRSGDSILGNVGMHMTSLAPDNVGWKSELSGRNFLKVGVVIAPSPS